MSRNAYVNDFEEGNRIYLRDIGKNQPMTKEEEQNLFKEYGNDMSNVELRNKFITANLKFVVEIAKRYKGRGLPFSDLVEEGNKGLIKAFGKFDPNRDCKFFTYASWWIKDGIREAIKKRGMLETMELPSEEDDECFNDDDKVSMTVKVYDNSRDCYLYEGENEEVETDKSRILSLMIGDLNENEKDIICSYYGIGKRKNEKLDTIASRYGLTRERVRQLKDNALTKMKTSAMRHECFQYI